MKNIIEFIFCNVDKNCGSRFDKFHQNYLKCNPVINKSAYKYLSQFLCATMDEVRLRNATMFVNTILPIFDMKDIGFFRSGLLRREISGEITYPKQRDHSAHTLYNYLIGWILYGNNKNLQKSFKNYFIARDLEANDEGSATYYFGMLWPIVSLLHDIGYLFEGSLMPLSTSLQSEQVKIGAEVAHEYFNHNFWIKCNAHSIHERERLRNLSKIKEPDFTYKSMAGIADTLRTIGDLEKIRIKIISSYNDNNSDSNLPNFLTFLKDGLPTDCFDLWKLNYLSFGKESMAKRIENLELNLESMISEGLDATGLRMLDHGICSGLLLLLSSTFFTKLYFELGDAPPPNPTDASIWNKFRKRLEEKNIKYRADIWWKTTVWATAATSIHNIQQQTRTNNTEIEDTGNLRIEEDPLAYLGILVDILQEWDRTTMNRESVIGGRVPLQGIDCEAEIDSENKLTVKYKKRGFSEKVIKTLNSSLDNWETYLNIL